MEVCGIVTMGNADIKTDAVLLGVTFTGTGGSGGGGGIGTTGSAVVAGGGDSRSLNKE